MVEDGSKEYREAWDQLHTLRKHLRDPMLSFGADRNAVVSFGRSCAAKSCAQWARNRIEAEVGKTADDSSTT